MTSLLCSKLSKGSNSTWPLRSLRNLSHHCWSPMPSPTLQQTHIEKLPCCSWKSPACILLRTFATSLSFVSPKAESETRLAWSRLYGKKPERDRKQEGQECHREGRQADTQMRDWSDHLCRRQVLSPTAPFSGNPSQLSAAETEEIRPYLLELPISQHPMPQHQRGPKSEVKSVWMHAVQVPMEVPSEYTSTQLAEPWGTGCCRNGWRKWQEDRICSGTQQVSKANLLLPLPRTLPSMSKWHSLSRLKCHLLREAFPKHPI